MEDELKEIAELISKDIRFSVEFAIEPVLSSLSGLVSMYFSVYFLGKRILGFRCGFNESEMKQALKDTAKKIKQWQEL